MKKEEIINQKLCKIIEQNNYIIQILEKMVDDKQCLVDLQQRFQKAQNTIRELEYS